MRGHVYSEGVCLLLQSYYKTVGLNNASIANAHRYRSIPVCVHFARRVRKLARLQASYILSLLTKLQPAATQCLGMVQTWLYKGNISHLRLVTR